MHCLVQNIAPVRHLAVRVPLAAILLSIVIVQSRRTMAEDASAQAHGPVARQAVERATYLERPPLSMADSDGPRPLPPAKRDSRDSLEKSDSPRALGAILSVVGSLTVVLGLFFLLTWCMRRGMPNSAARLPDDIVSVLGKAPLAGRQQAHLLRFGNKLLLVCASTSGFDTLGEITDPDEVQRIVSLCDRSESGPSTSAASRIIGQIFTGGSPRKSARQGSQLRIQNVSARAEEAADA
jgi:flagellar biogenesis protein FliO